MKTPDAESIFESAREFIRVNFDRLETGALPHKCHGCGCDVLLAEKTDGEIYCNIFCWQASQRNPQ